MTQDVKCPRCEGYGYILTLPRNANPFRLGGWGVMHQTRKEPCDCKAVKGGKHDDA